MNVLINGLEMSTPDLYFAAYLVVSGLRMKPPKKEGMRMTFVFEAESEADAQQHRLDWITGAAMVPASEYADTVKKLKAAVHQ